MAALRAFFSSKGAAALVGRLRNGTLPLIAKIIQADEMMALLEIKREVGIERLVIEGGAELHLILPAIQATPGVSIVLKPPRCWPKATVEEFRCSGKEAVYLSEKGILFSISQEPNYDTSNPRNLRWEAGFMVAQGVPYEKALYAVTKGVSDIYFEVHQTPAGLPLCGVGIVSLARQGEAGVGSIMEGKPAHFGVYTGNPLSYNGKPILVVADHMGVCNPDQYFPPLVDQEENYF